VLRGVFNQSSILFWGKVSKLTFSTPLWAIPERFSNGYTLSSDAQGDFFLRKKPLEWFAFDVHLLENRFNPQNGTILCILRRTKGQFGLSITKYGNSSPQMAVTTVTPLRLRR
jgi:hypothetical protein